MKEVVQVVLSSYNGEAYIRKQMDSILAQENVSVVLTVRDDGSTDGTKDILSEYKERCENVQVIYGQNLGVIHSFFSLLSAVSEEAKYIALADQDDIWLPDKLYHALKKIKQVEQGQPVVYCSGLALIDGEDKPLPSAIRYPLVKTEFGNALVENMCTGCTCVVNRELVELLQGHTNSFTIMHDFWIYLVGTCFGTVVYDRESYTLYRQHGNNELGAATTLFENYRRRIKNFKKHRGQLTRQAGAFLAEYGECMQEEKKELLSCFVTYKTNKKNKWKLIRQGLVFRQRKSDNIIMKLMLLLELI